MSSVPLLKERDFDIRVGAPAIKDKENNLADFEIGKPIDLRLNHTNFEASILYGGKRKARKLISEGKPELIIIHQPLAGNVTHALMTADQREEICFVLVFHAQVESLDTPTKLMNRGVRLFRKPTLQSPTFPVGLSPGPLDTINKRADGKEAVSGVAKVFWNQHLPGDYKVIYNGIDTNKFKRDENRRKELSEHDNTIKFFAAARFDVRKGLYKLLQAFNIAVYKKRLNVKLEITGDGPLRQELLEQRRELGLENYVDLLGFISQEELIKRYGLADYFILTPTGGEAFGLVLGEAMACETPVIGSNIAGYDEVIGENLSFAWRVNPNDPEDIASKIEKASKVEPAKRSVKYPIF